jgi:hypothetical protein
VNADQGQERLAELEAEATLLLGRVRTACDAGDLDEVVRLYRRAAELKLDLLAVRHLTARQARLQQRQYGSNPTLEAAEHRLAELLAALGVEPAPGMRRVFG